MTLALTKDVRYPLHDACAFESRDDGTNVHVRESENNVLLELRPDKIALNDGAENLVKLALEVVVEVTCGSVTLGICSKCNENTPFRWPIFVDALVSTLLGSPILSLTKTEVWPLISNEKFSSNKLYNRTTSQ